MKASRLTVRFKGPGRTSALDQELLGDLRDILTGRFLGDFRVERESFIPADGEVSSERPLLIEAVEPDELTLVFLSKRNGPYQVSIQIKKLVRAAVSAQGGDVSPKSHESVQETVSAKRSPGENKVPSLVLVVQPNSRLGFLIDRGNASDILRMSLSLAEESDDVLFADRNPVSNGDIPTEKYAVAGNLFRMLCLADQSGQFGLFPTKDWHAFAKCSATWGFFVGDAKDEYLLIGVPGTLVPGTDLESSRLCWIKTASPTTAQELRAHLLGTPQAQALEQ